MVPRQPRGKPQATKDEKKPEDEEKKVYFARIYQF